MALRWDWDKCIGELEIENQAAAHIKVYKGNALLIFLNEWKNEEGTDVWSMYNFFADKAHFDNCRKDKDWNYAKEWLKLTLWEVPSDVWHVLKDLAKRGVTIEIKNKTNKRNSR